ncbi:MAG: transporter substrate-binding domain-containing protein [Kordiimonadaceae bacterium]|jgi:ABC-type amino acid transport substrate-binding protein|nr:transporter substrate-binding domain-containing protein [Kordiimonadaceae bacterium]MBT6035265.1 transporter substrate-binding domain-containing protein [Kordiimonadaceae bacterium]MBT6328212.1 transporter substrate-binding domain-containing protein [Kordiimonadaceae bacterium]MBT7583094.1 transporter substrate-binding domain-containing protein [Kordiimonadaceae bacterium]
MYSINKLSILLLKHLFAVLLIAMTPLNVAAQSISEEISLTEEEQSWIAEHPTISAGNITAYAPFDFVSAGEPVGLSIDYLNLLASKVGLKIEYVNYGSVFENLKMGMAQKIDVLNTLSKTEERQEYFTFSAPYIMDGIVLWGRVGSTRINNINDLRDKRIGGIKGHFISTSYQKQYPDLNFVEFATNKEVLNALTSNEIDVYPSETLTTEFSISQNNIQGIEVIGTEFVIENSEIDQRINYRHGIIPIKKLWDSRTGTMKKGWILRHFLSSIL